MSLPILAPGMTRGAKIDDCYTFSIDSSVLGLPICLKGPAQPLDPKT